MTSIGPQNDGPATVDYTIRQATPGDATTVGQLLHDFNSEFEEDTPGPDALAQRFVELLEHGDTVVLLGGDGPYGIAVLRFRPSIWYSGLECYLAELYVRPAQRGNGLGRALLTAAIATAKEMGADGMDLGTNEDDVAARALYESVGFTNREGGKNSGVNYFYELEW